MKTHFQSIFSTSRLIFYRAPKGTWWWKNCGTGGECFCVCS